MTAPSPQCQPSMTDPVEREEMLEALANQRRRMGNEFDALDAELKRVRSVAAARIKELEGAVREVLESGALTEMEGCDCRSCAPVARARAALEAKPAGGQND